MILFVAAF